MLLVLLLEAAEPLEKRTQASSLDRTEYKRFFSSFRTFLSAVLVPNVTNISDVESCYRVVNNIVGIQSELVLKIGSNFSKNTNRTVTPSFMIE